MNNSIPQHMQTMNTMMNLQSSFPNMMQSSNHSGGPHYSSISSSSTSFNNGRTSGDGRGGGGIINGKRQTVTERVKVHPDGQVERTTETSGDDDFPAAATLGYGSHDRNRGQHEHLTQGEQDNQGNDSNGRAKKRRLYGSRGGGGGHGDGNR